jgi:stage II sporulation protein AA (anti-sigma F factor antagonist)
MEIREERGSGLLVIAPVGRLDSVTSGELEKHVVTRIEAGDRRLVVDMSSVEYISSAGLRVLLMAAKRLKEPPAALVLCDLGPSVRTVLDLAGFLPIFTVVPTRQDAVARLAPAS